MTSDPVRVVATVAAGPNAPALRVRSLIPGRALQALGVAVSSSPLFTHHEEYGFANAGVIGKARILAGARRRSLTRLRELQADTVVIHRQADITPSLAVERAAAAGRWMVYDVDDAIWFSGSRAAGGNRLAALKGSARKARSLASTADRVVAGNEVLADWLSQHARNITVIPSLVDTERVEIRRHSHRAELVLGWIGSRTTAPYLDRLATPLAALARTFNDRDLRLLLVGAPNAPRLAGMLCENLPWSEDAERTALTRMDIGIMPLPDDEWARAKCAYKAVQYMAAGIPVVADDVGITKRLVDGGGHVVQNDEEWLEALISLGQDAVERSRLGKLGRARVESDYSVKRWAAPLAALLRGEA